MIGIVSITKRRNTATGLYPTPLTLAIYTYKPSPPAVDYNYRSAQKRLYFSAVPSVMHVPYANSECDARTPVVLLLTCLLSHNAGAASVVGWLDQKK